MREALRLYINNVSNVVIGEYNIETKFYNPYEFLYIAVRLHDTCIDNIEHIFNEFLKKFYIDSQVRSYIEDLKAVFIIKNSRIAS